MRKLLIAAFVALTAFAAVTVANAQETPSAELTVSVDPKNAGTKAKPKPTKLKLKIVNGDSSQTASRLEIFLPKKTLFSTKDLKTCSPTKIEDTAGEGCSQKSRVGGGIANAKAGVSTTAPTDLVFDVTAFIIGKNKIGFYLEQQGGAIKVLARSQLRSVSGSALFNKKLDVDIPLLAREFPPGVFNGLVDLETTIYKKQGRGKNLRYLFATTGCSSSRKLPFRADITFIPNPNPPKAEKITTKASADCVK